LFLLTALVDVGSVRHGWLADVVGVKGCTVVFSGPQPAGQFVGHGAGGLVVADAVAELEGPGCESVQILAFSRASGAAGVGLCAPAGMTMPNSRSRLRTRLIEAVRWCSVGAH
jgi:hypothetical protein